MDIRAEAKYATVTLIGGVDDAAEFSITLHLYGGGERRFHASHRGMVDLATKKLLSYEEEQDAFGCIYKLLPHGMWPLDPSKTYTLKVDLVSNTIV